MKFFIKDSLSNMTKLRIWSDLLKKSLTSFFVCAVTVLLSTDYKNLYLVGLS